MKNFQGSQTKLSIGTFSFTRPVLENIFLISIAVGLPLFLSQPQILIGSVINGLLVYSALQKKTIFEIMPLVILPSIATLANNILFGHVTIFLAYFVPFIWIGNIVLVEVIRRYGTMGKKSSGLYLIVAALLKTSLLFLSAVVLVKFSAVPAVFLTAMGGLQLITALMGIIGGYLFYRQTFIKN